MRGASAVNNSTNSRNNSGSPATRSHKDCLSKCSIFKLIDLTSCSRAIISRFCQERLIFPYSRRRPLADRRKKGQLRTKFKIIGNDAQATYGVLFYWFRKIANRDMKVAAQNQNKGDSPESTKGLHFALTSLLR